MYRGEATWKQQKIEAPPFVFPPAETAPPFTLPPAPPTTQVASPPRAPFAAPLAPKIEALSPQRRFQRRYVKEKDPGFNNQSLQLVLQVLSERDRRIGELTATIRETKIKVLQQEECSKRLQDKISTSRNSLTHLDFDIEWHKRALESAEVRHAELETGHRRLMGELDVQSQKLRLAAHDALDATH